jgi:hypothetical protein
VGWLFITVPSDEEGIDADSGNFVAWFMDELHRYSVVSDSLDVGQWCWGHNGVGGEWHRGHDIGVGVVGNGRDRRKDEPVDLIVFFVSSFHILQIYSLPRISAPLVTYVLWRS